MTSQGLQTIPGGLLVAIEGIDGAGKTSAAGQLAQHCGERGVACLLSKEPTSLKWGQELRRSASAGRLSLEDELRLFRLDRQMHVSGAIRPALEMGSIVIVDRYYWSTAAYQGARGADPDAIMTEHESFAPRPDLLLLLDLPASTGLERIRLRGDEPNAFEKASALDRSRAIFLELAAARPEITAVIDATDSPRAVVRACLAAFLRAASHKFAGNSRAWHTFQHGRLDG